jgi:hypothetical protein
LRPLKPTALEKWLPSEGVVLKLRLFIKVSLIALEMSFETLYKKISHTALIIV